MDMKYLGKQTDKLDGGIDLIPWTGRKIMVTFHCSEFTSFCPVTGQPDYATLTIQYLPAAYLIETKSLKLFLQKFRDAKQFNEVLVDEIAEELALACKPEYLAVNGSFHPRGGIAVEARAERVSNKPAGIR